MVYGRGVQPYWPLGYIQNISQNVDIFVNYRLVWVAEKYSWAIGVEPLAYEKILRRLQGLVKI
jgi:hypothetical protein